MEANGVEIPKKILANSETFEYLKVEQFNQEFSVIIFQNVWYASQGWPRFGRFCKMLFPSPLNIPGCVNRKFAIVLS